jgi:hypothetical protein
MAKSYKTSMKRLMTGGVAAILFGTLGPLALAQNNPAARFDNGYLRSHPEVGQQLAANPALIDNRQYM